MVDNLVCGDRELNTPSPWSFASSDGRRSVIQPIFFIGRGPKKRDPPTYAAMQPYARSRVCGVGYTFRRRRNINFGLSVLGLETAEVDTSLIAASRTNAVIKFEHIAIFPNQWEIEQTNSSFAPALHVSRRCMIKVAAFNKSQVMN